MKLMKDIKKTFTANYLRKVDVDTPLASQSYNIAQSTAAAILEIATPSADKLFDALDIDANGNLHANVTVQGKEHTLRFSNYHKSSRSSSASSRLDKIKGNLERIKNDILDNINNNIKDQCSSDTQYFNWSGLDFSIKVYFHNSNFQLSIQDISPFGSVIVIHLLAIFVF